MILAVMGTATAIPELLGRPVKLWRLSLPPIFCAASAWAMVWSLDGPLPSSAAWVAVVVLGLVGGLAAGRFTKVAVDQIWGLVRVPRVAAGVAVALGIVAVATGASMAELPWSSAGRLLAEAELAEAAIFFASVLVGRAASIIGRAATSPHADLLDC